MVIISRKFYFAQLIMSRSKTELKSSKDIFENESVIDSDTNSEDDNNVPFIWWLIGEIDRKHSDEKDFTADDYLLSLRKKIKFYGNVYKMMERDKLYEQIQDKALAYKEELEPVDITWDAAISHSLQHFKSALKENISEYLIDSDDESDDNMSIESDKIDNDDDSMEDDSTEDENTDESEDKSETESEYNSETESDDEDEDQSIKISKMAYNLRNRPPIN